MKKLAIFLLIMFTNTNAQTDFSMQELINKIKNQFAPDSRTAVFDISFTVNGTVFNLTGETNLEEAKNNLISELTKLNIQFNDQIKLLPEKQLGMKIYAVVNVSVSNIRKQPKHSSELITQALLGTPVSVLKSSDDWYLIQTEDNYLGWVDSDGIQRMTLEQYDNWNNSEKMIYLKTYGFAFTEPDENSIPQSDLAIGNLLKFISEEDDYFYIEYPDKRRGFVPKDEMDFYNSWLDDLSASENKIVEQAEKFIGIPYLWGGTSSKGFDCSGFTKTVYLMNGILLPRDASQQVNVGIDVDTKNGFDNLMPGDLLFFGTSATDSTKEKVTHVAIYIGDMKYIHSSGRVRINSLDENSPIFSQYRFSTFLRAKRILSSINKNGVISLKK